MKPNARFELVPTWWKQESFQQFFVNYKRANRPLFFVGSGLSLWAGLPDWASLLRQLASHGSSDVRQQIDAMIRDKSFTGFQQAGSLLKKSLGDRWRPILDGIFDDPRKIQQQSQVHNHLVSLKWHRIITTNYDLLLETAAKHVGLTVSTLHYASSELTKSESRDEPHIIHLHGVVNDSNCNLILAKEDYDQLYLADDSHSNYYERTVGATLRNAQVILFVGYGYDDQYVASLLERSLAGTDAPVFALVPRRERQSGFADYLQEQRQKRGIRYISYSRENSYYELFQLFQYLAHPDEFEEDFEWRASVRRPTVVFIRGGGTINARSKPAEEGRNLGIEPVKSRYDHDLEYLATAVTRYYRWYSEVPIDIVWEILPPGQQLLSENAVVDDWNNMSRTLHSCFLKYFDAPDRVGPTARIHDPDIHALFMREAEQYALTFPDREKLSDRGFMDGFRNRYILGFVVLYGTDTLAFLASALSFGLRHIPCPIIITGANQPLFSGRVIGGVDDNSDGWRNLLHSLFFLQCFGHRLTEFFVLFGDTVHHGVNLRKRAVDIIPFDREQIRRADYEPFMYRNLSLTGQYMFRMIDGLFCNNYYAATTQNYHELINFEGPEHDLCHLRQNPFVGQRRPVAEAEPFSGCVKYVELSPSFPKIDTDAMIQHDVDVRVMLVEGYNSGTYPSVSAHSFASFLFDLDCRGIPVVLVSRYGIRATQEEYHVLEVHGRRVEILRLYGMVMETALPLLSLVVGRIGAREWNSSDNNIAIERLADHRRKLVRQALDQFFEARRNILSEELKYSTDRDWRFRRMTELRNIEDTSRAHLRHRNHPRWRARERRPASPAASPGDLTAVPRADFLDFLEDLVSQFERVGARPDGFLSLNHQGFALGEQLASQFEEAHPLQSYPWRRLFDRADAERERLKQQAQELLVDVAARLRVSGIAGIEPGALVIERDASGRAFFDFVVRVSRGEPIGRTDERYAATAFSEHEAALFKAMLDGCPLQSNAAAHEVELQKLYDKAVQMTWPIVTHNIDWFVVGFFKGVCCTLSRLLGFDREENASHAIPTKQEVLRQSIACQLHAVDRTWFQLRLQCVERPLTDSLSGAPRGVSTS